MDDALFPSCEQIQAVVLLNWNQKIHLGRTRCQVEDLDLAPQGLKVHSKEQL